MQLGLEEVKYLYVHVSLLPIRSYVFILVYWLTPVAIEKGTRMDALGRSFLLCSILAWLLGLRSRWWSGLGGCLPLVTFLFLLSCAVSGKPDSRMLEDRCCVWNPG